MELALQIVQLLNAATPGIAQLIVLVRQPAGTVGVVTLLDQADVKFADNMKQAKDWLESHPRPQQ